MDTPAISIESMTVEDVDESVDLINRAMNPSEGQWAQRTMDYHFTCQRQGIDDGRTYYVWRLNDRIAGLVGLHHYLWGPDSNVWLSWFAVDPSVQRQGYGRRLLAVIEDNARKQGYRQFLVETYNSSDFDAARAFYRTQGFEQVGHIKGYLPDGSDMIVYGKNLSASHI